MAMTTKYVTTAGAGAKNGTDAANAWDWATMLTSVAAGDDVLVQEGTYSLSANSTFTNAGTSTSPIRLRGAKTDWTPLYPTRTSAGPLSTTNMPVIAYADGYRAIFKTFTIVSCLKITGSRNGEVAVAQANVTIHGCVISNANTGASIMAFAPSGSNVIFNCDLSLTGATGGATGRVSQASTDGKVIGCRISGGSTSAAGIDVSDTGGLVLDNVIVGGGIGISITSTGSTTTVNGNTISGTSSDGIRYTAGSTYVQVVRNNLITDCGGYGVNGVNANNAIISTLNRIDRCTSGAYNSATDWLASTKFGDDVTSATQANEYENAGSGDFRLKSTSPAIGKGPWLLGDIGALQTVGGGGYTYGDEDAAQVLTTATGAGTYQAVAASNVVAGVAVGVSPAVGTYPTTATSQAAQLATDQAAVLAAAESIDGGTIILGQEGTGVNLADVSDLLDAKIPQPIQQAQIGGAGVYYVLALTSGGDVIAETGEATAALDADPTILKLDGMIEGTP
jgi:hypothetical protein